MSEYIRTTYPLAKVQNPDGSWRKPTDKEAAMMNRMLDKAMQFTKKDKSNNED